MECSLEEDRTRKIKRKYRACYRSLIFSVRQFAQSMLAYNTLSVPPFMQELLDGITSQCINLSPDFSSSYYWTDFWTIFCSRIQRRLTRSQLRWKISQWIWCRYTLPRLVMHDLVTIVTCLNSLCRSVNCILVDWLSLCLPISLFVSLFAYFSVHPSTFIYYYTNNFYRVSSSTACL